MNSGYYVGGVAAVLAALGLGYSPSARADVVSYWRFEESSLQTDSSGHNYNLNSYDGKNIVPANSVAVGAPGQSSLDFSGANSALTVNKQVALSSFSAITIEFYAKLNAATSGMILQNTWQVWGSNGAFSISINDSGQMSIMHAVGSGAGIIYTTTTSAPVDFTSWHHFAVVIDNSKTTISQHISLYVDHDLYGATSANVNTVNTSLLSFRNDWMYIGNNYNKNLPLNGYLDELRISSGVLLPSEFLPAVAIPEASSLALLGIAGCGMLIRRRMIRH